MEEGLRKLAMVGMICEIDERLSNRETSKLVVRANLSTVDTCNEFVKRFGELTRTNWIVIKQSSTDSHKLVRVKSHLQYSFKDILYLVIE